MEYRGAPCRLRLSGHRGRIARVMRDQHASYHSQGFDVEIAAIATTVPKYPIDQRTLRDMVLAMAPEFRSHEALFLNTGQDAVFVHARRLAFAAAWLGRAQRRFP